MARASSDKGARSTCSWVLVSSRHSAAGRSAPRASAMATRESWTRRGDSRKIMVRSWVARDSRARRRSPGLRGRNPSKQKRSEASPDRARAVSTAEGPGATVTGTCSRTAAWTSRYPGSETEGMPASETTRTRRPARAASSSSAARSRSLCSWKAMTRPRGSTSRRWARDRSRRVSSAAMRSACSRARRRRSEASETLPIGVAARVIVPPRRSGLWAAGASAAATSSAAAGGGGLLSVIGHSMSVRPR